MGLNIIARKLLATFFSTTMTSLLLVFYLATLWEANPELESGMMFYAFSLISMLYMGLIILVVGTSVSVIVELITNKWIRNNTLVFVILHMLFGLFATLMLLGGEVILGEIVFIVFALLASLLYALVDRWFFKRTYENNRMFTIILTPFVTFILFWAFFQFFS